MNDRLGKHLLAWRIRTVLPHVRGRLLDIGCGANELARKHGNASLGVDVFQWGDVDLVVDDTAKLPYDDASFDTCSILAALNHIPNRGDVLKEAFRVLKPGGRMILTMIPPTISKVWHFLRRPWDADQTERGMKDGEVWGLTPNAVRQLLTDAGFEVTTEQRFMLGINRLTIGQKPAGAAPAVQQQFRKAV
jgi:ubiquinone/menaquinone biosynthesis C-methylase UbiE